MKKLTHRVFGGPWGLGALGPGPPGPLDKTALLAPFFRHGSDAVRRRRYRAFTTSQLYIWRATEQYARTVALRHVHFANEQRCCSTRSLLPSIRWRHSAVHVRLTSLCHISIQDSLCIGDICRFFKNRLLLNPSKTEAVLFAHVFSVIRFQHRAASM